MNQGILRIQEIFHKYVAKVWLGTNFGDNMSRKLIKIVPRIYVKYNRKY